MRKRDIRSVPCHFFLRVFSTFSETEREFVYSERSGLLLTSILTLRGQAQAPPRVICTSHNLYGTKSLELPFQGACE